MNNKKFLILSVLLFILEFFLLEGYKTYPFPEIFMPLLFLDYKDKSMPLKAFTIGILMDLSTNNLGIFSFSYSFYSILLILIEEYISDIEHMSTLLFLVYDILIKFTNILLISLKFHAFDVNYINMVYSVFIDFITFLIIKRFIANEK